MYLVTLICFILGYQLKLWSGNSQEDHYKLQAVSFKWSTSSRISFVFPFEWCLGMVTFADPRELRQALVEMDHHMVSSEMTAPEGGLASLVQHVLRVKLTEVCHTFMYSHRYFIYPTNPCLLGPNLGCLEPAHLPLP